MKKKIAERGFPWQVDSAGTGSWHTGERPDSRSIGTARRKGIDITDQRARQLIPADLDRFDLVLAMDSSNFRDISNMAISEGQKEKIHLIMNFLYPGHNQNVPDPYWDDNGFDKVFEMLEAACEKIIEAYS